MAKDESTENTKKIVTIIDDYSLFEPTDATHSDLRVDFPEIGEDPAFRSLQARELRFCWYVSNRTSPLAHVQNQGHRVKTAVEVVWGKYWENNAIAVKLHSGELSLNMKGACERMSQFNPSKRLRARLMSEYAFDQVNSMIIATQAEINEMDFDERKKYTALLFDTIKELPAMVDACERGYGIRIKKTKEAFRAHITAADLHNELANE